MFQFLDSEREAILSGLINHYERGMNFIISKDKRYLLKELIDNDYLEGHLVVPAYQMYEILAVTEKGKSYFAEKEKENTKDYESWERFLYKLLKLNTPLNGIFDYQCSYDDKITIKKLQQLNLIDNVTFMGKNGVGFNFTYDGIHYFENRNKKRDTDKMPSINFTAFANCENLTDCKAIYSNNGIVDSQIVNSPVQLGNNQSSQIINYNFQQAQEILDEIKIKINDLKLSCEHQAELEENVAEAEELIKQKKKTALKAVMKTIGGLIKDFGVSMVSGLLLAKMQGLM